MVNNIKLQLLANNSMTDRINKINELLHHELGLLIAREVEFSNNCLVTITHVDTSKDLKHSNIYVSVLPESVSKQAVKALYDAKLQNVLFKKLSLKPLTRLHYRFDETEKKASSIESLLDQIKKTG